ncbi:hypothetical protein [Intestinimonas sp. HCP28S3_D6]|uniref:hypothetical protein n=1 Tax=Intestinimonas sp. HCP28S3_D6 TaxID=3438942 RepID=UPI003F8CA018
MEPMGSTSVDPIELSGSICDVQILCYIFKNGVTGMPSLPEVDGLEIIDTDHK